MSATPWMKFYPSDWRADPALRMCGLAARGLWMEMLALMHEATPRGLLLINGNPVAANQLAVLVGADTETVENLLSELETGGVFSRKKNGVIFSRRMERDENLSRKNRENGKKGGNPSLCNIREINGSDNRRDKTQKPEARSQKLEYSSDNSEIVIDVADGADAPTPSKYAFEAKNIRLISRHLEAWKKANPHIQVESALWSLDEWAGTKGKDWFNAVAGALAKREQEAMRRIHIAAIPQVANRRLAPDPRI